MPLRCYPCPRTPVTHLPSPYRGKGLGVRFFSSARGGPRVDGCDAQSPGGPSDVEADDVAFADQLDSRHGAANLRPEDGYEWKLEGDLFAAMRAHHAAAAAAVELEDHPLVEVSGKALAVIFVFVGHDLRDYHPAASRKSGTSYGIDMHVCNSPTASLMYPIALAL